MSITKATRWVKDKLPSGKAVLGATVAGSLVASNVAAAKIAQFSVPLIGSVTMPAGFVGIAAAFLATDLLSELYGKEAAREAVNGAIASLGVAWAIVYAAILMPAAPFYPMADAFEAIMGQGASIVLASIATLLVSQNLDVHVFHAIKRVTPYKFARNVGSTSISQAVDTALFITLGFVVFPRVFEGNPTALGSAWSLMVGQYLVKLGIVAADTPLFYAVSGLHERLA